MYGPHSAFRPRALCFGVHFGAYNRLDEAMDAVTAGLNLPAD